MLGNEVEVLRALANGVNYFTGEKYEENSILNDPNIIRTLFNVCESLSQERPKTARKSEFYCPENIEEAFEFEKELTLTKILQKVNAMNPNTKRLRQAVVKDALIEAGVLKTSTDAYGKTRYFATDDAKKHGIFNVQRTTMYGKPYSAVVFNEAGQRFVLLTIKDMFK